MQAAKRAGLYKASKDKVPISWRFPVRVRFPPPAAQGADTVHQGPTGPRGGPLVRGPRSVQQNEDPTQRSRSPSESLCGPHSGALLTFAGGDSSSCRPR